MSRELLEKAAKAAGFVLVWGDKYKVGDDEIDCTDMSYIRSGQPDEGDVYWNPIDDDGDAFRLAVKLGIEFRTKDGRCWFVIPTSERPGSVMVDSFPVDGDPYAATRLAIVRAAAAMGEKP